MRERGSFAGIRGRRRATARLRRRAASRDLADGWLDAGTRGSAGGRPSSFAPIGLILVSSFFRRGPFGGIVYEFTLANYTRAIDPLYLRVLWYSVRIADSSRP